MRHANMYPPVAKQKHNWNFFADFFWAWGFCWLNTLTISVRPFFVVCLPGRFLYLPTSSIHTHIVHVPNGTAISIYFYFLRSLYSNCYIELMKHLLNVVHSGSGNEQLNRLNKHFFSSFVSNIICSVRNIWQCAIICSNEIFIEKTNKETRKNIVKFSQKFYWWKKKTSKPKQSADHKISVSQLKMSCA